MQRLEDLGCDLLCRRMTCLLEHSGDVFYRSVHRCLWRRGGLQNKQGRALLEFREQLQGDRIGGLEAGGELIDKARLTFDQRILITGQFFEFLHDGTVWLELFQVSQITSPGFRQDRGVNGIRFGSSGIASAIHRFGIDWIDRNAGFQQGRDEQAAVGARECTPSALGERCDTEMTSTRPILRESEPRVVSRPGVRPHR